jgi:hypothetical protein
MIFKYLNTEYKNLFKKILQKTTVVNVKEDTTNISVEAYRQTLEGLRVIENSGGGDCFFIAVADAINYYNYSNPNKKITYTSYGTDSSQLFTTNVLRNIVAKYIINLTDLGDILKNVIQTSVDIMNDTFKADINKKIAEGIMRDKNDNAEYMNSVNNIYKNSDNYLIGKVTNFPDDINDDNKYFKPYSVLNNRQKIIDYITSSDYWANSVAIDVMASVLGISIIVIEKKMENPNNNLEIPYQSLNKNDKCDKYLFLYKYGSHYELITFDYTFKIMKENSKGKMITRKNTIFEIKENEYLPPHFLPPYYILFLLFGAYYFKLVDYSDKANFLLYPEIFNAMQYSFDSIYNLSNNERDTFLDIFSLYFPVHISSGLLNIYPDLTPLPPPPVPTPVPLDPIPLDPVPLENGKKKRRRRRIAGESWGGSSEGGAPTNYNPYQTNYNQYRSPTNFIKKDDPYDKSNISYYITIDMELQKGTEVTNEQLSEMKCNRRWNSVRKEYANLTGMKYVIPPVYSMIPDQKNKTEKNDKNTNMYTKNNRYVNENQSRKGGRKIFIKNKNKNKTHKNILF